jgi:hypothetical protein
VHGISLFGGVVDCRELGGCLVAEAIANAEGEARQFFRVCWWFFYFDYNSKKQDLDGHRMPQ